MAGVPFVTPIRVRWGEVDAQGVVFNPNYFVYADVAATEFFRAAGVMADTYPDLGQSYVVDARASFRGPARFDDLLDVEVRVSRIGRSSYELQVDIRRGDDLLTQVTLTYVRAVEGCSEPLSDGYRDMLGGLLQPGSRS